MLTTLALLTACTLGSYGTPAADLADVLPEAELNEEGDVTVDSIELSAALSEHMGTVIHVTWDHAFAEVTYESGGDLRRTAGSKASDGGYEAWLIGPAERTDVTLWLEGSVDGVPFSSETVTQRTGTIGVEVPVQTAWTGTASKLEDGLILLSWLGDEPSGVALVDRAGRTVWAAETQDRDASLVSAAWTAEGLWTLEEDRNARTGQVVLYNLDGSVAQVIEANDAHHDLTPLPNGGVAWLESDARNTTRWGKVYGDRIVIAEAHREPVEVFSTWDLYGDASPSETWDGNWYDDGKDWTHANGLTYSEERDSFLLSLAGQSTVMELDAADFNVRWEIEGQQLSQRDARFVLQHSPTWTSDDTVVIFVNVGVSVDASWAAEFDVSSNKPTEIWHSGRTGEITTHALGRAARLNGGNTLVNYGVAGVLQEVDDRGDEEWELSLSGDTVLGQSDLVDLYED